MSLLCDPLDSPLQLPWLTYHCVLVQCHYMVWRHVHQRCCGSCKSESSIDASTLPSQLLWLLYHHCLQPNPRPLSPVPHHGSSQGHMPEGCLLVQLDCWSRCIFEDSVGLLIWESLTIDCTAWMGGAWYWVLASGAAEFGLAPLKPWVSFTSK
jgi:hypothetical protein